MADRKKRDLWNYDTYKTSSLSPFAAKVAFDRSPSGIVIAVIVFVCALLAFPVAFQAPPFLALIGVVVLTGALLWLTRKWENDTKFGLLMLLVLAPGLIAFGRLTGTVTFKAGI